ncbi:MAG: FkbM family methyltransferase [Phycisphaeraceae bacterium]|nr:FkbM family methyltransferase [Phycisphaeraceae bacterium]
MSMRRSVILFLQKYHLYLVFRELYQIINPGRRHARKVNREFYAGLISPGDLIYDVGANVGQTIESILAIGAKVISIEPNSHCQRLLHKRFRKHRDVKILGVALGANPGKAILHFDGTESTASLREDWPFPNTETQEVEVLTLDMVIAEYGYPKLLKVDVEGFELEVFHGLTKPIPIVYFEMLGHKMDQVELILKRLSDIGTIDSINLVTGDNSRFYFDEWVEYEDFFDVLPEPIPVHANVIIRMSPVLHEPQMAMSGSVCDQTKDFGEE